MKRYTSYKDSGVEWLGEIPEHWELIRLKYIFQEVNLRSETGNEILLSMTRNHGLIPQSEMTEKPPSAPTLVGYKLCNVGEIVMNKMQAWNGMFSIVKIPGVVSPDYTVFKPCKSLDIQYYIRLFKTPRMIDIFHCSSKGLGTGFFRLYTPDFGDIVTVYPPPEEQKAIAHFLDHKLEQIEQYIRNKKRLIELLNEQKTALINRAVTKGINPNAPMKHSGIEWLGEIPAHWEVKKLNFMTKRIGDGIHSTPQYVDSSEYYFINGNNLVNGNIVINESTRCVSKEEFEKYNLNLDQDTLLLSINGTIGNVAFYKNESVILGKSAAYITLKSEIFRKFAYYFLISKNTKNSFLYEVTGTTIFNLSLKSIKNTFFPTPPPEEQKAIVFFIESQCAKIDFAIAQIEKEIELIQEYRTTLISDAVTGKIDVRGFDNSSNSRNSPKPPELATM